jgi:hypothetical protein
MTPEKLLAEWGWVEDLLGSPAILDASARESGALVRRRHIRDGSALLRLCLGYGCGLSLREAAVWAGLSGIGALSDVAVLKRLRGSADWLSALAGRVVGDRLPQVAGTIRIIDGSMVSAPGGGLWRLHAIYDLAGKRFSHIELTDRSGAEKLERGPVAPGEIRIGDRCYARPEGLRHLRAEGGNFIVRIGWKSLCLQNSDGTALDLQALLGKATDGAIDMPVQVVNGRKRRLDPVPARLVIIKKDQQAVADSRKRARRSSTRGGHVIQQATLKAADYLMLVTSLDQPSHSTTQVAELYRLRWQIELAFKRLKSLLDFAKLPAKDTKLAKSWLLAKLLTAMIIEDLNLQVLDSPPSAPKQSTTSLALASH